MAYKTLYRTYRPATFEEVAGQKHIVVTLQNALKKNKLAHAYLFCGPRGTGKTSIAKLLAKAVNCTSDSAIIDDQCDSCLAVQNGTHPDIIEIDAASNNGVDEIRELIEKVKYSPIQGKYKVYIIDEVHMLSIGAFNALLKTLEEPPAHVIFILATTEPHKVIPTIISRCQRFDFSKVKTIEIKNKLKEILNNEGTLQYDEEAIDLICALADGGVRDALSILDQCSTYADNRITLMHVNEIYGITTENERFELLVFAIKKEIKQVLDEVNKVVEKGADIKRLTIDLMNMLKDAVIYHYTKDILLLKSITKEHADEILSLCSADQLLKMIDILINTNNEYRNTNNIQSYFELSLLKISNINYENEDNLKDIITKPVEQTNEVKREAIIEVEKEVEVINDEISEEIKEELIVEELEQEIEDKKEEQNNQSSAVEFQLDEEYYLSLLVGASKEKRNELNAIWNNIGEYAKQLEYGKAASKLMEGQLVAVGKGYLLVCVEHQAIANSINTESEEKEWMQLTAVMFQEPYRVFGVEKEQFKNLVELFKKRSLDKTLPKAVEIEHIVEKKKEEEVDEKMAVLFGEGMFDIVEE